ncbi:MAG: NAD(P)H-hydrate dehydratase [Bernardetiaceae bacterium]
MPSPTTDKILTAEQIRQADQHTIAQEPISSLDLMERAAQAALDELLRLIDVDAFSALEIVCGIGNNGGDGLVIARRLLVSLPIRVTVVAFSEQVSGDFAANLQRLQSQAHVSILHCHHPEQLPVFSSDALILDALFGVGLNRPITEGLAAAAIRAINQSGASVIAIDLPSGLMADDNRANPLTHVVRAKHTLTFEVAKRCLLLDAYAPWVGQWHLIPIGLEADFLEQVPANDRLLQSHHLVLPTRSRTAHKGTHGHALLCVGSYGKMGAALLAGRACLRAGAGLLTLHIPRCGYAIAQTALPEAMTECDSSEHILTRLPEALDRFTAIGVGCGIGQTPETAEMLHDLIRSVSVPLVLDADALNLLARHPEWLSLLPKGSILTPHPKELSRLIGEGNLLPEDLLERQRAFSQKYHCYIIGKGAYSRLTTPEGKAWFHYQTGNPGMATGGSGDMLTGILAGLLAQGYTPEAAVQLGVYWHGKAGDLAAQKHGMPSMLPSDMIEEMGAALGELSKQVSVQ